MDQARRDRERHLEADPSPQARLRAILARERVEGMLDQPLSIEAIVDDGNHWGYTLKIRNNSSRRVFFESWYDRPGGDRLYMHREWNGASVSPAALLVTGPHRCGLDLSRFGFRIYERSPSQP